jgi:hypothetical protein
MRKVTKDLAPGALRIAALAAVALLAASDAGCQQRAPRPAPAAAPKCEVGELGSLGLSGWDCRGDCTITLGAKGEEKAWSFSVEPRITGVAEGGPADGILQAGDILVAVDGLLITTAEGGERLASLPADADVKVRYRREGRLAEAVVRTVAVCGSAWDVPPPPPPPAPAEAPRVVAPRVRVTGVAPVPDVAKAPRPVAVVTGPPSPPSAPTPPRTRLGIGFTCSQCGTRPDSASGGEVWFFSRPPEVTAVDAGGAADRAGIQIGDRIVAVSGAAITTDAGGRAFGAIRPGVAVRLTVAKRNGREDTVTLVPESRDVPAAATAAEAPAPSAAAPPPRTPGAAVPPPPPAPADLRDAPAGLPLRYSGTLAGVEVEVRGKPVMVSSETQPTRTLVIWSDGLWIRIRVPASGGR